MEVREWSESVTVSDHPLRACRAVDHLIYRAVLFVVTTDVRAGIQNDHIIHVKC
jgi:hypothetical protein